mmetsp:Transcript_29975/g.61261  ORF Transcript_29975/g.61261 Transcript_29975/m.61261 type:complete len:136 (+) Transcript_29975:36-443(+)|eukprot:CAMPEP_0171916176 /NCGR_PEP_ID=MMETSP0993-20121228/14687_1 /TAXON_ID=483369 /ORGANISM="non described non described, Strain CCMP2098" /LENGTH=135 /DNA_ID=CAMNT_0012551525 /DNA_START=37 /DNA_END=444 /DNA_ORIENTATION=-
MKARDRKGAGAEALAPTPVSEKSAEMSSVMTKALTRNAAWTKDSFPEYPDVIYWLRQIIGLSCGLAFGFLPVRGLLGFIGFFTTALGLGIIYVKRFSGVDEDIWYPINLFGEGLPSAFGVFCMVWIMTYTLFHSG